MAKQEKQKSAFIIKLSTETLQKLNEEEGQICLSESEKASDVASLSVHPKEMCKDGKVNNALESQCEKANSISNQIKESMSNNDSTNQDTNVNDNSDVNQLTKHTDDSDIVKEQMPESVPNNRCTTETDKTQNTSWGEYAAFVTYEDDQAIYTDPSTQQKYTWNKLSNTWDPIFDEKGVVGRKYSYENDTHIYTENDGSKFFWDAEKHAWIPKVDDDFLAMYQMSYGFIDNTKKNSAETENSKDKDLKKKTDTSGIKRKNEPQWFEPTEETNTKVYVSNLPLDMTEEEFVNLMQKCGLVERDPCTQKMKVKMYVDKEQNCFKGDALCTYIKIESVDLALNLLDGSDYNGHKIKVERAHFQLKGEYNPALKPKKKRKKELEKIKKMQQKLFDWRPEKFIGERSKHERVVIVKNLFNPTDFDKDVQLILDYQQDLREESTKCGEVRKVVIYDRHPEGVAQITMKEPEQADAVVQLINGRWFGKRQITAEIWDGRTKYRIAETDADINKRITKWDKFLEGEEDKNKETNQKVEILQQKCEKSDSLQTTDKNSEPICEDSSVSGAEHGKSEHCLFINVTESISEISEINDVNSNQADIT